MRTHVRRCDVVSADIGPRGRRLGYVRGVKLLGLIATLSACSFQSTRAPGQDSDANGGGPGSDVAVDGSPDAVIPPDLRTCFGVGVVSVCLAVQPSGAVNLPGVNSTIDTTLSGNCVQVVAQQGGPSLCVIAGTTVTVSGSFVAIGARPLVLIATEEITVNGSATLDASSVSGSGARRGAGANPAECSRSDKGKNDSGGAGGGAGGSFGTVGGIGGTGDVDGSGPPGGAAIGGTPGAAQTETTVLRGGCIGGAGGDGNNSEARNTGGAAGDGGGAVYLIAGNRITINGNVFASGGGGRVTAGIAGRLEGAGGGGSGGMIVLDAPTIQVQGRVVANGGAGGGGGGNVGGTNGGDGSTLLWNQRAAAGIGDPVPPPAGPAGNGAQGTATGAITNLDGSNSDLGAGGGAGGLGLIWTYGTLNGGAMMSPAPDQH
jgi:hypothetical protein